MKTKNLAIIMSAVPIAAIGVDQAAVAQGTSDKVFEEIVVTAQRREQSIYDVPVAISAFSPETIERQGITDLVDLGKFVPNLNVTGFSAGHTSSANPFIRGIGLQDHLITTEPGVGVYVDGIYLGRQVGQNWNLTNIERVEVLRGPQGTLYGRNSIGGAINIITRKPGDEEGGKVSVDGREPRTGERRRIHQYAVFGPGRHVVYCGLPEARRARGLSADRGSGQGSRRNAGHLRARRTEVDADGSACPSW